MIDAADPVAATRNAADPVAVDYEDADNAEDPAVASLDHARRVAADPVDVADPAVANLAVAVVAVSATKNPCHALKKSAEIRSSANESEMKSIFCDLLFPRRQFDVTLARERMS